MTFIDALRPARWLPGLALPVVLLAAACGPNAQSSQPTPAPTRPPTPPSSSAQVSGNLTAVPNPAASPAAAAAGGSVATAKQFQSAPPMQIDPAKTYTATIETSMGSMQADLFASDAPATVNNFVFLARQGFYDGVTFHRVIKDFMVQTGDPTGTGTGGPGYKFNDEPVKRKYERGTLAMANAGKNTNGSQFFIVHKDYPLPPNYTIFGKLSTGLETLDKIATTPTGPGKGGPDTPTQPVTITHIAIEER